MSAVATQPVNDPHTQLRRLYTSLLEEQSRFDEFKQLLALYPVGEEDESDQAGQVRARLNGRINEWLCGRFDGLSAAQVVLWRSIVVEERINLTVPSWKESNS
jgi:hypothetical protein